MQVWHQCGLPETLLEMLRALKECPAWVDFRGESLTVGQVASEALKRYGGCGQKFKVEQWDGKPKRTK